MHEGKLILSDTTFPSHFEAQWLLCVQPDLTL